MKQPLLIRAYKKESVERAPIWLMRQAGRYLPEYQAIRAENSINEVINNPDLAYEVTMQPLRRFPLDAAIIFADLLTPFQGFGFEFDFLAGSGPHVFEPISLASDVDKVKEFDPFVSNKGTMAAVKKMRTAFDTGEYGDKALIGFSGAPFTTSSYLIEGKSNPKLHLTKGFIFNQPEAWHALQAKLTAGLRDYLLAQVESGAQVLQIFDSWLGGMSIRQYQEFVEPYLMQLFSELKEKTDVPLIFFATGVNHLFAEFKKLPVDAIGVDWRQDITLANEALDGQFALQGNIDPLLLFGKQADVEKEAKRILAQGKDMPGFVFNLGHGILPKTPIPNVAALIDTVVKYT